MSILDVSNSRLEATKFTLPLQKLGYGLDSFSLDLTDRSSAPELEMEAAANATLWHRAAMVRRMLVDRVLPKFCLGILDMHGSVLGNGVALHDRHAVPAQVSRWQGAGPAASTGHLRQGFKHIETGTKNLELKVVEGR